MSPAAGVDLRDAGLRALLSLPTPALRALAGGGVIYQGGRTLDPRLQYLTSVSRRAPSLTTMAPAEARAATAGMVATMTGRAEPGVRIESLFIPTDAGPMAVRAYRHPDQNPDFPIMVYAHLGGGVIGDLSSCEVFCSILARVALCPVISIAYRLAPEHRFPAGVEDMLAAYRWARENAQDFGAPAGRAAVGGDSMGGNFAAVVPQETKRLAEPEPELQLLIYPALDLASESPSMTAYADAWPLSRADMQWFMGHYMGPCDAPGDPRLSPLRATDLSGLAPAVIATAGFDPLADQGEAYARRLRQAGAFADLRVYDTLAHAFTAYTGLVPAADVACRDIAAAVRARFALGAI